MTPQESVTILTNATRLAHRILRLADEPEYGIDKVAKIEAAIDVLDTAMARADGADCGVTQSTHKILHRAVTDIEVRILYSKLGLTEWGPA